MKAILLCVAIFFMNSLYSQKTISGLVTDDQNKETLPFANVVLKQGKEIIVGTTTDLNGLFSLKDIPDGVYELSVSYLGYQKKNISVNPSEKNDFLNFSLTKGINLKEVVIVYEREESIHTTGCSSSRRSVCSFCCFSESKSEKSERKPEKEKEEKPIIQKLSVFPNPSTGDDVTLNYQNSAATSNYSIHYSVHDLLGKLIESQKVLLIGGQVNLKLSALQNLPKGSYFISLSDKEHRSTKKIIIQ